MNLVIPFLIEYNVFSKDMKQKLHNQYQEMQYAIEAGMQNGGISASWSRA